MLYSGLYQHNSNLREHQIEAKGKIFDAWDKYDSVMLQMPTGIGKTYLFTSIVNDLLAAYKEAHRDIHSMVNHDRIITLMKYYFFLSKKLLIHFGSLLFDTSLLLSALLGLESLWGFCSG